MDREYDGLDTPSEALDLSQEEEPPEVMARLKPGLAELLAEGFGKLSGTPICAFKWKIGATGEPSNLSIAVQWRDGAAELRVSNDGIESPPEQLDNFSLIQSKDRLIFRARLRDSIGYADIDILDFQDARRTKEAGDHVYTWEEGVESKNRPQSVDDPAYFEKVWYGIGDSALTTQSVIPDAAHVPPWLPPFLEHGPNAERRRGFLRPKVRWANDQVEADSEGLAAYVLVHLAWRVVLAIYSGVYDESFAFPSAEDYEPRRPVDLKPHEVFQLLASETSFERMFEDRIIIPWHVLEAACASLNAGKHVIFTGPPGCGKSKLAQALAIAHQHQSRTPETSEQPIVATAAPSWTTAELLGQYVPKPTKNGFRLEFREGFFLQAAPSHRWLIIDEVNRADIDSCFGELFSVLAGDMAQLPFDQARESDGAGETADERILYPIRVVPPGRVEAARVDASNFRDFQVPRAFRLIATMNDADRGQLHELSFAFQRRFNIIRVESPSVEVLNQIIEQHFERLYKELNLSQHRYMVRFEKDEDERSRGTAVDFSAPKGLLRNALSELCANSGSGREFRDLVQERVIGVATVIDLLNFVAEECRAPEKECRLRVAHETEDTQKDLGEALLLSFLALGVVISVVPQLDALRDAELHNAVNHVLSAFKGQRLQRIRTESAPAESAEAEAHGVERIYHLECYPETIAQFLAREIHSHLKSTGLKDSVMWKDFAALLDEKFIETELR